MNSSPLCRPRRRISAFLPITTKAITCSCAISKARSCDATSRAGSLRRTRLCPRALIAAASKPLPDRARLASRPKLRIEIIRRRAGQDRGGLLALRQAGAPALQLAATLHRRARKRRCLKLIQGEQRLLLDRLEATGPIFRGLEGFEDRGEQPGLRHACRIDRVVARGCGKERLVRQRWVAPQQADRTPQLADRKLTIARFERDPRDGRDARKARTLFGRFPGRRESATQRRVTAIGPRPFIAPKSIGIKRPAVGARPRGERTKGARIRLALEQSTPAARRKG